MEIREAKPSDISAITDIWQNAMELFSQTNSDYWKMDDAGSQAFTAYLTESLSKPDVTVTIAEDNKTALGFTLGYIELLPEWFSVRRIGLIRYMGVSASVRGEQIGTMMFEFVSNWFRARNIDRVELYVLNGLPASDFWAKLGFSAFMERRFLEI